MRCSEQDARRWSCWLLAAVAVFAQAVAGVSPPVKVQLRAPWSNGPSSHGGSLLLLELLEAAHSQQPSSFLPLIDTLVRDYRPEQLSSATDQKLAQIVQQVIETDRLFGSSHSEAVQAIDAWKLSLALHDTSPRIQAFAQIYRTLKLDQKWATRSSTAEDCHSWVDWNNQVLCSASELKAAIAEVPSASGSQEQEPLRLLPFDHVASSQHGASPTKTSAFVLYADPYSANFAELHTLLQSHTQKRTTSSEDSGAVTYILRWRPSSALADQATGSTHLAGYGAILDLKKVDYLVIDDRKLKDDSQVGDLSPDYPEQGQAQVAEDDFNWLRDQIGPSSDKSMAAISEEEMIDLGLKAAELIHGSPDPLRALQELSQNFPLHAATLGQSDKFAGSRAEELVEAVLEMGARRIEPGGSDFWLNGLSSLHADFHPLKLLQTIRNERSAAQALSHPLLGGSLNTTQVTDFLSSSIIGRSYATQSSLGPAQAVFDASDRIEKRSIADEASAQDVGAITWLNDLEKDEETKKWSKDLMDLLRPMWPGKFPRLSLNLFNIVLVLDLSKRDSCRFLSETVAPSLGKVGLHWGIVPGGLELEADSDSVKVARLFWFLVEAAGPRVASDVLRRAAASSGGDQEHIDVNVVKNEAKSALKDLEITVDSDTQLDNVLKGTTEGKARHQEQLALEYIQRLRVFDQDGSEGHVFVNGQYQPFHPQLATTMHQTIQEQIQKLAPPIYYGQLNGRQRGLDTYFYDSVGTLSFRSTLVPDVATEANTVVHSSADLFSVLASSRVAESEAKQLFRFFYPRDADTRTLNSTLWVLTDLDTQHGASLLEKAAQALVEDDAAFRLGVIHVPRDGQNSDTKTSLSAAMYSLLADSSSDPSAKALNDALSMRSDVKTSTHVAAAFWSSIASVVSPELGLADDACAILVDGHLISNIDATQIESRDITAVVQFEAAQKLPHVVQALQAVRKDLDDLHPRARQDLILAAVSVLNTVYNVKQAIPGQPNRVVQRTSLPETIGEPVHTLEIGDRATATIRLVVLLDPLSESAQKWSSVLRMLSKMDGVYLRLILNPQVRIREMPLKRFYRYSAPHELQFDSTGREVAHELRFDNLPEDAVLTLGLDAPAPWLTMSEEAVYDLDNIRLSDIPSASRSKGVKAIYELKHILIEGHARDINAAPGAVPRGAQLLLETPDGATSLDTIVMANLAYFQFKAQPGLWKLRLRPGRSDEVYEMVSVGNLGWNSPEVDVTGEDITLDTLSGLTIYPRLQKRAGKENDELLDELDARGRPVKKQTNGEGSVSGYASSLLSSAKDRVANLANKVGGSSSSNSLSKSPHADINIFTVASGHLYERMVYIMVLSVLKHTSSTVKFWFIENFLSPSFKEFIPHLAEEYGFQYELVTYAWPHWLRSQKEKQRTIWGYKILFLDTLFPLDLTKVIFVDADQVVRTDLKELVDVNLEGKVYGYPPMGDDSYDMDGFRFWKQGYWKEFLNGRPYHISALYVVDLVQFRRFAAGDRLRGQYQALSADPNSLSNLDQDLPNNMQAMLPIHTLDKEWLWCETWCSTDWLYKAKTIDLCSNPKTKEPKLQRARRQIPEWTALDQEVAALAQRLVDERKVGNSVISPGQVEETSAEPAKTPAEAPGVPHDEL